MRWAFWDGKGACAWSSGIWCLGAVGSGVEKRLQRQAGLSIPSRAPWTVWRSARLTSLHAHSGCYVAEGLKNESEVYTVVFEGSTMYSHSLLFLIFWQIFGADTGVDIPPGRLYLWQLPLEMWTGSNCISFEFFFCLFRNSLPRGHWGWNDNEDIFQGGDVLMENTYMP